MSDLFDLPFEEEEEQRAAPPAQAAQPVLARRVLTVTELTVRIRDLIEADLGEVWVEGEISNCRLWKRESSHFESPTRTCL